VLASLTQGGLAAATKSLGIELAPNRVRVNAVSPCVIDTPMHPDDAHPVYAGMHPLGRMGSFADIVRGVLYLESAAFVTGDSSTLTAVKALAARPRSAAPKKVRISCHRCPYTAHGAV